MVAELFADMQHARVGGSLRFFWLSRGVGGLKLDVSRQKVKACDKPHPSLRVVVVCVKICGPILQESGPHAPQSAHVTALEDGTSEIEGQPEDHTRPCAAEQHRNTEASRERLQLDVNVVIRRSGKQLTHCMTERNSDCN